MKGLLSSGSTKALLVGCCCFLLSGCISSGAPLHEYTLTPLVRQSESTRHSEERSIMIMPVLTPPWNTDSGIVTRSSLNDINTSSTHLWAGSLQGQLTTTLAENIRRLGTLDVVQVYPGSRFAKPKLLLELEFLRFDGKPGKDFTCSAIWTISDNQIKKTIRRRKFYTTVPVDSDGYTSYVAAASMAISKLSAEIGLSLQKIRRAP